MGNFGGLTAVLLDRNQPQANQYLDGTDAGHALQPCGRSGENDLPAFLFALKISL
jgi:hypothetical protein